MEEELELVLESTRDDMDRAIVHMEKSLLKIRAGRASASILDSVMV